MKHRNNRLFWTALGSSLVGGAPPAGIESLPPTMRDALNSPPPLPGDSYATHGEDQPGKKGRYIYTTCWNTLRDLGFRRPLRVCVLGGIELLIPFVRNSEAVVPQGFQSRVPLDLRALALVGKSAALRASGYHLIVCSALYIPEVWEILERGRCSVCTPDHLVQLVNTLDF